MENTQIAQQAATHSNGHLRVLLALISTYIVFAILLNSVGTVILQSISSFGVSKTSASTLEGFKDIPIAVVSFLFAAYLPKFGFKRAMLTSMLIVASTSLLMPIVGNFMMTKLLFLSVGVSFALVKVSVYALIGKVSHSKTAHASNMNIVEGCFMVGVLMGYWLFAMYIDPEHPESMQWLSVYWLLAGICIANFLLLWSTDLPEDKHEPEQVSGNSFAAMLKLAWLPFVVMFVICAFFYVLVEQGVGTWLPTFNNTVLNLANHISVQITSIFAACLAIGRLSAGVVLRKLNWFPFLMICLFSMAGLILLVIPMAPENTGGELIQSWSAVPLAAFILPLVGLFMAPIYPAINSVVLSSLPTHQHAAMTGLIVIFSALGGTLGSLVTGMIFEHFDGQTAFYFMLCPIMILMISLSIYKKLLPAAHAD